MEICKNRENNIIFVFQEDEEHVCDQMLDHVKKRNKVNFARIYTYDDELFLEFHYHEAYIAVEMLEYVRSCLKPDTPNKEGVNYQIDRSIATVMDWHQEKVRELS